MIFNNDYYQKIINEYPEHVNKEQFYKIAHISKRTAQYLLQSKKVPCVESNKKTRKYKIKTLDIVAYLIDRELRPEYYCPSYSEKINSSSNSFLYSKMSSLTEEEKVKVRYYFAAEFKNFDDILTAKEVSDILGVSCNLVSRKCRNGNLFSFFIGGKRLIPKLRLVDFLSSSAAISLIGKSKVYAVGLEKCLRSYIL